MHKKTLVHCLMACVLLAGLNGLQGQTEVSVASPPIKVMSFNIRYGAAKDGTNSWPDRQERVVEVINTFQPDLLGLQEVLDFQAEHLKQNLPGYAFHGVGREDGSQKGEHVPVMFRTERFEPLDAGFFWLSETPEIPGSQSWDAALPRMLSWVLLADRRGSQRSFIFANAHFDHRGSQARLQSARLIRERALDFADDYPIILCGDFNCAEDSAPYQWLLETQDTGAPIFIDSYRAIHPVRSPNEATFNNWKPTRQGSRIDWILHTAKVTTLNSAINYTMEEGRLPSDHYPVEAVVRLKR